ncbi:hypothetical protein [Kiritimatiella glycovorans]|uniref:Uncharacterized protein n=1 Tax=Kiritimatiella glycovorans TaxID=1307763 RepID=A0A0G3EEY2_9BACT|nr:hypothetical protein [Kiritimatiella glycovorans]AKJ63300.1 hypothetical protein L21SP4_00010 [Kiritimatiella glycovorans]
MSEINYSDPVGKTVGRRRMRAPLDYGMKLQSAAGRMMAGRRSRRIRKGVYRFTSFEEADRWTMENMADKPS